MAQAPPITDSLGAALGAVLALAEMPSAAFAVPYPPDHEAQIGDLKVAVWLPTGAPEARPLVLFSHGFGGCKTQSTYLMRALAQHGLVVAAADHGDKGVNCPDELPDPQMLPEKFRHPESWSAADYVDRRDELRELLAELPTDPILSGWSVDPSRVALVGHSLGGYTVLGLTGAWAEWKTNGIVAVVALALRPSVPVRR